MDLYEGQFDFNNFSTQVHDFDLGIEPYPEGLFWTVQIAPSSVGDVSLEKGTARYAVQNLHLKDFFSIPNALFHLNNPTFTPATTSFDIRWAGPVTDRQTIRDTTVGFEGEFVSSSATMSWSAWTTNFKFESDPAETSSSVLAVLGHERNGVYFK